MLTPPSHHKTRPGADCGSDQEILIVKFKLKLKKVRETIRPFKVNDRLIVFLLTLVEIEKQLIGHLL